MPDAYELQCLTCGGCHSVLATEVPAGPAAAAAHGRECPDCALHGRPAFPLWRWRRLEPPTAAERLWARGLVMRVRQGYGAG